MRGNRLISLAGFAILACATPSQPGNAGTVSTGIQVPLGREFDLGVGQEARVQGTPVTIRFIGVAEDSRCPADVQCVWAGNAAAQFVLSSSAGPSTDAALNTTLEPRTVIFSGYRVRVAGVKPATRSGVSIPAGDYVVTLDVTVP